MDGLRITAGRRRYEYQASNDTKNANNGSPPDGRAGPERSHTGGGSARVQWVDVRDCAARIKKYRAAHSAALIPGTPLDLQTRSKDASDCRLNVLRDFMFLQIFDERADHRPENNEGPGIEPGPPSALAPLLLVVIELRHCLQLVFCRVQHRMIGIIAILGALGLRRAGCRGAAGI